jgi:hypothetical protein
VTISVEVASHEIHHRWLESEGFCHHLKEARVSLREGELLKELEDDLRN